MKSAITGVANGALTASNRRGKRTSVGESPDGGAPGEGGSGTLDEHCPYPREQSKTLNLLGRREYEWSVAGD